MHGMQQTAYRLGAKKDIVGRVQAFKRVTHDLLFACGSSVEELVPPKNFKEFHIRHNFKEFHIRQNFKEFHIRQNLKCLDQVEVLYYSAGFPSCCSH